ncbi:hypothetical protein [Stackebrandtia soli]|uniref:hypothetical protein n=1 Tax=Stackebrandtia soli TaxID=1892856 RepID=UPI0039ECF065
MIRKFLALSGISLLATLAAPGVASADELTTLTATATPDVGKVGDAITATITVTNTHDRKITYLPLSAPPMFSECGAEVGTLVPGQTFIIECTGVLPEPEHDDQTEAVQAFSIGNAPSEHNITFAEATLELSYAEDEASSPPPPSPKPDDAGPTLPITGAPAATIALVGTGAIAAGVIALRVLRRRSYNHE